MCILMVFFASYASSKSPIRLAGSLTNVLANMLAWPRFKPSASEIVLIKLIFL